MGGGGAEQPRVHGRDRKAQVPHWQKYFFSYPVFSLSLPENDIAISHQRFRFDVPVHEPVSPVMFTSKDDFERRKNTGSPSPFHVLY